MLVWSCKGETKTTSPSVLGLDSNHYSPCFFSKTDRRFPGGFRRFSTQDFWKWGCWRAQGQLDHSWVFKECFGVTEYASSELVVWRTPELGQVVYLFLVFCSSSFSPRFQRLAVIQSSKAATGGLFSQLTGSPEVSSAVLSSFPIPSGGNTTEQMSWGWGSLLHLLMGTPNPCWILRGKGIPV